MFLLVNVNVSVAVRKPTTTNDNNITYQHPYSISI